MQLAGNRSYPRIGNAKPVRPPQRPDFSVALVYAWSILPKVNRSEERSEKIS